MKKKIDWSGLKFVIAEELGECMDCYFIRHRPGDDKKEIYVMNHQHHDGVGGFTKLLERHFSYRYEQMPEMRSFQMPKWWEKLSFLWRFLKLTQRVDIRWKKQRLDTTGKAEGFVVGFFNQSEVALIEKQIQNNGGNLNSTLFWAIDKVVTETLLLEGSERKWISPINMRGSFTTGNPYGNNAASIVLNLSGPSSPQELHQKIRQYFKDRLYIGSWLYTNMAKFIGLWGTRKMAKKIKDLGVGVYSNMGPWPPATYESSLELSQLDNWVPTAPSSQILPVGAVLMQWQGQLSFSLQIHPSLQISLEKVLEMSQKIVELVKPGEVKDFGQLEIMRYRDIDEFAVRFDQ